MTLYMNATTEAAMMAAIAKALAALDQKPQAPQRTFG